MFFTADYGSPSGGLSNKLPPTRGFGGKIDFEACFLEHQHLELPGILKMPENGRIQNESGAVGLGT